MTRGKRSTPQTRSSAKTAARNRVLPEEFAPRPGPSTGYPLAVSTTEPASTHAANRHSPINPWDGEIVGDERKTTLCRLPCDLLFLPMAASAESLYCSQAVRAGAPGRTCLGCRDHCPDRDSRFCSFPKKPMRQETSESGFVTGDNNRRFFGFLSAHPEIVRLSECMDNARLPG
jgi:hypothetical protein